MKKAEEAYLKERMLGGTKNRDPGTQVKRGRQRETERLTARERERERERETERETEIEMKDII